MSVDSYIKTSLSPYKLNEDAMALMKNLNENFSQEIEKKILILINAAALHPKMSLYQLSLSHKALGDCYYKYGFFQSALEQYERALSDNPKVAVKRRIKEITAMDVDKRKTSLLPDVIDNVLDFPEYKKLLDDKAKQTQKELDEIWADADDSRKIYEKVRCQMAEDNSNSLLYRNSDTDIDIEIADKFVYEKAKELYENMKLDFLNLSQEDLEEIKSKVFLLTLISAKFLDMLKRQPLNDIDKEIWNDYPKLYCKAKYIFDDFELRSFHDTVKQRIKEYRHDEPLSLKELLLLDLQSMLRSAIYRKKH